MAGSGFVKRRFSIRICVLWCFYWLTHSVDSGIWVQTALSYRLSVLVGHECGDRSRTRRVINRPVSTFVLCASLGVTLVHLISCDGVHWISFQVIETFWFGCSDFNPALFVCGDLEECTTWFPRPPISKSSWNLPFYCSFSVSLIVTVTSSEKFIGS